jgi:hypothetical protein
MIQCLWLCCSWGHEGFSHDYHCGRRCAELALQVLNVMQLLSLKQGQCIYLYIKCKCKLALYWVMLKVLGTRRFSRLFCYVTCWGLPVWKQTFSIIQQLHLRAKRALLEKRFFEMSCVRLWHNWHSSLWEPFHWQLRIQDSFKCHMFDSESYLAKVWTVDSGPATSCRDAIRNHPAKCASTLHNECSTAHCWLLA